MNKTVKDIEEILKRAKTILQNIYGRRLQGVVLHGSYARGEADEGSDIDLIVLLEDMQDPLTELERCSPEIHQLDFLYDTVISVIPMDVEQYKNRKLPLILQAKKEGVLILSGS